MSSTTLKTAGRVSGNAHRRRSGGEAFARRQARKKAHSEGFAHRTGFLKQRLKIVPVKPDIYASFFKEYLTEENFGYLAECAVHYAGLLGKTIEIPKGTVHDRISILYHRFAQILPKGHCLNFETGHPQQTGEDGDGKNRLMFLICHLHQWNSCTFYWMPVGFINKFSGKFREIALSFMHLLIRRNGLARFRDSYEYDFMFEYLVENIANDGYEASEKAELSELLLSYQSGGISFLLDEVYDCKPLDVVAALAEYQPECTQEKKLLDCFRKGLPFISEDCIMNYDYNPDGEGFPEECREDYPPVTIDRTIRYVYTLDDFISNELEGTINQDLQESYATEPASYMFLHPASNLFCPGDYPERFSDWFLEMVNVILEISDHE